MANDVSVVDKNGDVLDGENISKHVVTRILKSLIVYMGIYNIEDKYGVIEHLHRVKKSVRVQFQIPFVTTISN